MKVEDNWVISYHKPTFNKPLRPGTWKVKLVHSDNIALGETSFLVVPMAYSQGKAVSLENIVSLNNGPSAGLYTTDFVIDFDREANDTQIKVKEFSSNSFSVARPLDNWIDILVARHWNIEDNCVVGKQLETCLKVNSCQRTSWSSLSPDPKSDLRNLVNKITAR